MKNHIKNIPSLFVINGTIGVLPIIICMLLSEFISAAAAIYISFITAILALGVIYWIIGRGGSFLLLLMSAVLLLILGISTLIPSTHMPDRMLPFYAEIGLIIFVSVILYEKRKIKKLFLKKKSLHCNEDILFSINSGAIYSRIIQLLCTPHFIIASLIIIFASPLNKTVDLILLHILPPAILFIAIIASQIGLSILLSLSSKIEKVPVLNDKGEVVDKKYSFETFSYKNQYINPIIRIAIISKGMLFLSRRSEKLCFNPEKIDLPLECYLRYEEKIEDGVNRLMHAAFQPEFQSEPRFSIKYRFRNDETNRLIYLYILYVDDDSQLCSPQFIDGKLWTIQQIETNLEKNFFGECFETEYEQLKEAILISEEFKTAQ